MFLQLTLMLNYFRNFLNLTRFFFHYRTASCICSVNEKLCEIGKVFYVMSIEHSQVRGTNHCTAVANLINNLRS